MMPVFAEDGDRLIGYVAIMEHWLDLGAKDFYCTDTVDVYQEGLKVPALKLYRGGHMFYIDPQSRKAFTTDARTMYASP